MSKLGILLSLCFLIIKILKQICVCLCGEGVVYTDLHVKCLARSLEKYQFVGKFLVPFFFSVSLRKSIASQHKLLSAMLKG